MKLKKTKKNMNMSKIETKSEETKRNETKQKSR